MTDLILTVAEGTARTWKQEAQKRRAISATDPVADTLEYCAGEITARLREAAKADDRLTVEEYAKLADVDVTPQTVRTWIRHGELAATPTPKGYLIARDARRVRRRKAV